eukprot:9468635-Pyramimonas_sp.AAC.1
MERAAKCSRREHSCTRQAYVVAFAVGCVAYRTALCVVLFCGLLGHSSYPSSVPVNIERVGIC